MAAKTAFCLYLFKLLIVTLRCAVNVTTSSFQHFPCIQTGVIHNLTRCCGSVYLGVVVLRICEVCYVYEGYVGSAVVLYI